MLPKTAWSSWWLWRDYGNLTDSLFIENSFRWGFDLTGNASWDSVSLPCTYQISSHVLTKQQLTDFRWSCYDQHRTLYMQFLYICVQKCTKICIKCVKMFTNFFLKRTNVIIHYAHFQVQLKVQCQSAVIKVSVKSAHYAHCPVQCGDIMLWCCS